MKYDVFISYSRKDTEVANKICQAFDEAGISYFIDRRGIVGGMEFPDVLAEAIRESKVFLFLASNNSYASKFTQSEIVYAFNKKQNEDMIPYIIDGSTFPDGLELTFSSINWRKMEEHPIETVLVDDVLHKIGRERKENVGIITETPKSTETEGNICQKCGKVIPASFKFCPNCGSSINSSSKGQGLQKAYEADATSNQTFTVNGVSFTMVGVQGGTFMMGATSEQGRFDNNWVKPVHQVTLNSFMIGETEVTQELWQAVMGSNPSKFKGNKRPVECVSWDDCQTFIRKLNSMTGQNFRLPTEAEWEYAARGGNRSNRYKYAGSNSVKSVAWYWGNSEWQTHDIGQKLPNELGLYDMSGNVSEWCQDWWDYYSPSAQTNPRGPSSGSHRVFRGGSSHSDAKDCRVAYRYYESPGYRNDRLGFRLAL